MNLMERRRRAIMGKKGKTPDLPSDFQEVTYIRTQSAGPYVQTDITLTNGSARIIATILCTSGGDYGRDFVGVRRGTTAGQQGLMIKVDRTRVIFASPGNTTTAGNIYPSDASFSYDKTKACSLDVFLSEGASENANLSVTFTQDGVSYSASKTAIISDSNAQQAISFMGSSTSATRAVGYLYGRSYVWNDGVLVLEMVPCYRKIDSVVGLFDTVHQKFYPPVTGTFTKGADV